MTSLSSDQQRPELQCQLRLCFVCAIKWGVGKVVQPSAAASRYFLLVENAAPTTFNYADLSRLHQPHCPHEAAATVSISKAKEMPNQSWGPGLFVPWMLSLDTKTPPIRGVYSRHKVKCESNIYEDQRSFVTDVFCLLNLSLRPPMIKLANSLYCVSRRNKYLCSALAS